MSSYFEYILNLTDNQKTKWAYVINTKSPLTLRLTHPDLQGNDEVMLTKR